MHVKVNLAVEVFISALDKTAQAKTIRTIELLQNFGAALRLPHSKPMTGGLFELRVRGRQEVRVLYCFHQSAAVLLHGFMTSAIHPCACAQG